MRKSSAFPTLDSLVDLACRDGVDIRPTLLRVLTDLYVQKPSHSAEEEVQYAELALGLIEAVDAPTRAAVATRLSSYAAAPAAVVRRLAGDLPAAEAPRQTEQPPDLIELFFAAGSDERRLILINLDAVAADAAQRALPVASDVIDRLETAALRGSASEFSRTLERALGVGGALAERIAHDPSGEPTVVAAKALGMKAAVLQRILLCLNPKVGQSVERVYDLARLFDELSLASALRMVAIWRQTAARPKPRHEPRHEPLHWDDVHKSARSHATHAVHRAVRTRDVQPSRIKSNER